MDALPKRQRRVLEMRQFEGRSAEDVCESMQVSAGNQRVLLHRARGHLRRAMADYRQRADGPSETPARNAS
ncbi:MAG: sigma factor-like helix-turn-helix DNA-binding protein [Myxococcota bacterium]